MAAQYKKEYQSLIKNNLLFRFRVVSSIGSLIYIGFGLLDKVVYPEHFPLFFKMRVGISLFLVALYFLSFTQLIQRQIKFWIDLMIIIAGGGIAVMIAYSDGSQSDYYQGISIVLLANFAANSFDTLHNLFSCSMLLLLYQAALLFHPLGYNPNRAIPANFFMGATLFFVVLLTKLYRKQHYAEFLKAKELELAYQKLRETEALKSEFFSNVSHELRTPLSLIMAPLESMILEPAAGVQDQDYLKVAYNNALKLFQMISGLLDFSKLEAGKMQVQREPLDLGQATQSILSDFSPQFKAKNVEFALHSTLEHPVREMDRYMFDRIVTNLLSNALKFTAAGGTISVQLSGQNSQFIECTVKDTGIGIKAEDLPKLFQRFRQIEGASVRRFEGTGLGLALVKELCELLEGNITVQSESEKGSEFKVRLRAPYTTAVPQESFKSSSVPYLVGMNPQVESIPMEKAIKLLVVEDNSELGSYLTQILGKQYTVKWISDGEKAWSEINEWKPDLVLSDVMMPKMDGFELCRKIKDDKMLCHTPVILLTALTHRDALLKGWNAGADEYLFKPFHPIELTTRLRSFVTALKLRKTYALELEQKTAHAARKSAELEQLELFQFVASHQFQEPLHKLLSGFADLKRNNGEVEFEQNTLAHMKKAAERLQIIVKGAHGFANISKPTVSRRVDLNQVIEKVKRKFAGQLIDAELRYDVLPTIQAEEEEMVLLFSELFSNSLRYKKVNERLQIKISAVKKDNFWNISVEDNGIGFDPVYSERVFEPFRRLHPESTYGEGVGIGLALCRKLALKYDGAIIAESQAGKGTRIIVRFPVV